MQADLDLAVPFTTNALPPTFALDQAGDRLSLSPSDADFFQNPYPACAALHAASSAAGPIVYWNDYGHWVFGKLNAVNALFRDRRLGRQITHRVRREALGWPSTPPHLSAFYALEATSLLEMETVLPMVLARWPDIEFAEQPRLKNAYHFRGLESLMVSTGSRV